jgi:hypothetical protein
MLNDDFYYEIMMWLLFQSTNVAFSSLEDYCSLTDLWG